MMSHPIFFAFLMRLFIFILFLFLPTYLVYSEDIKPASSIKTEMIDGKPLYFIEAGSFPHENNALQLKLKLSSSLKQMVTIEPSADKSLFIVKVGPIDNLKQAEIIQNQLMGNFTLTGAAKTTTPTEEAQAPSPDNKIWNLRDADIHAVANEVSRITGKNFILDPRVQGKISIISHSPLSNKELYQVFLSGLQVSGYAAIPSGPIIKIVPNLEAKSIIRDFSNESSIPEGDELLVEVVAVQNVPAEQLVPVLRPLMPQSSTVSAFIPSNRLVLSGRAENIKTLAAIIKQTDSPSAYGIDMIPLKYALAMDIANTLKDLVKPSLGANGRAPTVLTVDDRSNAILISGNRTDRLRLRLLIARLDKESPYGTNSNTQVVYLNYLRAEDLVPILAGIAQANFSGNVGTTIGTVTQPALDSTSPYSNFANGTSSTPQGVIDSGMVNPSATPTTSAASSQNEGTTKPNVQIIAEPNTNSIIINAPVSLIRILKNVINQLDIKPAQILIEALVAEVDESDVTRLGIEWGSMQQTNNPGDFRPGFAIINSKTSINDFQAQIYALSTQRKANILSTPSVVVLDNRQAKILVGKQVSVATTTYPNNAGGTTTASPYVTYDRVNVALHLYVRPQITRGEGIQLQIDQGNDTLDPSTTLDNTNPIFKISSIVTSVHIESGNIIVLGGLAQDSLANDNNGLPILGGIPGIGRLFQRDLRNREKRVLMVFIRPIIIKNERSAFELTGSKYIDIRQYQLDGLREQDFNKTNKDSVLPPLTRAELPLPFTPPPQPSLTK